MCCKKGVLVLARHNDVKHKWNSLCSAALGKSAVSDKPLIHTSQDVVDAGAGGGTVRKELRGDVGVHNFWRRGTTAIFDAHVTDLDARY